VSNDFHPNAGERKFMGNCSVDVGVQPMFMGGNATEWNSATRHKTCFAGWIRYTEL
jgi:hypothetical protein